MSHLDLATALAIGVLVIGSIAIFVWFLIDIIRVMKHNAPPTE